ncbi:MAG: hypothetical protein U0X91_20790 [Spirosomataceae bacterium]
MPLSFSALVSLIQERFRRPNSGLKIRAVDSEDVATALANFITNDGSSLPPYAKPNPTLNSIPYLSATYQQGDSKMAHFTGLGGGVQLNGAWMAGANALLKTELFQPTAHASNRYETKVNLPKGAYGLVTVEIRVRALGQSAGLIHKVYAFDANTSSGAVNTTLVATGDITTKIYVDDPDWSGANIIIPIYEKAAVNSAKIYLIEVAVSANTTFITPLLVYTQLLSAVATTARSAGNTNTVSGGSTQMSLTSDASGLKLVGDVTTPGASQIYGTNAAGTRGWYAQNSLFVQDFDLINKDITLVNLANSTTKTTMANLAGPGAIGTTNIVEFRCIGTFLNTTGSAVNGIFELEITTNAGTSNLALNARQFHAYSLDGVYTFECWAYRESTAITVLVWVRAGLDSSDFHFTWTKKFTVASSSSITNMKMNVTLGTASPNMTIQRRVAWIRMI